jgi:cystathionine beta-lyase
MTYNFDELIDREGTLSVKHGLKSKLFGRDDIIPMWVADMDFKSPDCVAKAIQRRAQHEIYGYSYRPDSFYQAAKQWLKKRHQWGVDTKWMNFTPGIVPGVNLTILALTQPNDRVMIQPPVYFPFFEGIKKNNRTLVENRLILEDGRYQIDFEDFENQLKKGVKLFILSNPHNPGGNVWTEAELKKMGELCVKYNTLIIADEIHGDIVFPPNKYRPLASMSEDIANQTITFIAPSKTFNVAGLASSVSIIQNKVTREAFSNIIDSLHIANGNLFGTVAFEAAYRQGERWLDQLIEYLGKNLEYLTEYIDNRIDGIKVIQPEGTYLAWLDCRELPIDNSEIHQFMIDEAGIGMNNGASFGENGLGFQRLNFGCTKSVLETALGQLETAVNKL